MDNGLSLFWGLLLSRGLEEELNAVLKGTIKSSKISNS